MYTGGIGRFFDERWTDFLIFTAKRGLNVEEIYLEGQHYANADEILTVLGVQRGEPILGIPIQSIKQRIELLSWVKYASIERQLPNVLHVRIVENTPAALWQYDKKLYVITREGEVVEDSNIKPFAKLPILVGEDAPDNASALLGMVDAEEALKPYFASAIRIGERRWNVRTPGGIEIKLPEEGQEEAWKRLALLQKETKVLDSRIASVDLRLPDKITIGRR
ncbi:MAG: Cell division protein ftsQ [Rickettsiales bacterium]|nr:Cell division protein ftsQ [Rickettsiales bacterium]